MCLHWFLQAATLIYTYFIRPGWIERVRHTLWLGNIDAERHFSWNNAEPQNGRRGARDRPLRPPMRLLLLKAGTGPGIPFHLANLGPLCSRHHFLIGTTKALSTRTGSGLTRPICHRNEMENQSRFTSRIATMFPPPFPDRDSNFWRWLMT